jgi:hypothetical protein
MFSVSTYLSVGDVPDRTQQLVGWNTEFTLESRQVAVEGAHQEIACLSHQDGTNSWEVRVQGSQMPFH